jgi:nucleoside 2-deoxyribosyltransferase
MKVYIAAPWVCKEEAVGFQDAFEAAGFEVTSHWIKHHPPNDADKDFAVLQHEAIEDFRDLDRADVMVIFNMKEKSEGKATELGWALNSGKPVVLVGERSRNVFYYYPTVVQTDTIEQAIQWLQSASL